MTKDSRRLMQSSCSVAESEGQRGEVLADESARADLTVEQILAWADAHHAAHGTWPQVRSTSGAGPVDGAPGEWWKAINYALALGGRGLPGDSSLAELLAEHRGAPPLDMRPEALAEKARAWEEEQFPTRRPRTKLRRRPYRPLLNPAQILAWADAHHAATGSWPTARSGAVRGASFDVTWSAIQSALVMGMRGLPGGSSLPRLLVENQRKEPPTPLTVEQILAWADAHHAATGRWPTGDSSRVLGSNRESWRNLDNALISGGRGLPGGQSLSRLLQLHRGILDQRTREPLTIDAILAWADAHHAATGDWPARGSGPLRGGPDDLTWNAVSAALQSGHRGLPGGSSLLRLMAEHREKRAALSVERILAWADAHHAATGSWPTLYSGKVVAAASENWYTINGNLKIGRRGLPGRQSLAELLAEHRGAPNAYSKKPLTIEQVLAWADADHAATGRWPIHRSGPVGAAPGETWAGINAALKLGGRDLPVRITLAQLLLERRGPEAWRRPPSLTVPQILAWADAHHAATGRWPHQATGAVTGAPGETWFKIEQALHEGYRCLPGGSSIARLLAQHRGHRNKADLPPFTLDQIVAWADAHHAAHGRWPTSYSGPVLGAAGETWRKIASALQSGHRGLSGDLTLARLLAVRRGARRGRGPCPT